MHRKNAALKSLKEVAPEDVKSLRDFIDKKSREEGRLAGMNLVAKIKQLESMDEIPEKFRQIDDPEKYGEMLDKNVQDFDNMINALDEELREAERKLGDKSAEEYSDELQEKEEILEARKAEYEHWKNIYDVYCRLKEQIGGNPVEDIETRFREYLGLITDGQVQLSSMDEQMSVQLATRSRSKNFKFEKSYNPDRQKRKSMIYQEKKG